MPAPSVRDVVAALKERFAGDIRGIAAVYLFGSVARGTAGEHSDVDVAVLFDISPPRTLDGLPVELAAEIEHVLGRRVDLVVLNHAPADVSHRVLRDGILVANANPSARIQFEIRARNEYFDLEPILRRYRRTD